MGHRLVGMYFGGSQCFLSNFEWSDSTNNFFHNCGHSFREPMRSCRGWMLWFVVSAWCLIADVLLAARAGSCLLTVTPSNVCSPPPGKMYSPYTAINC